jgi:hypothetical protein
MMPGRPGTATGASRALWSGSTVCPWRGVSKHAARRDLPSRWTRWKKRASAASPSRTRCPRIDSSAAILVQALACPSSDGGQTMVRASGTRSARQRELPRRPPHYLIAQAVHCGLLCQFGQRPLRGFMPVTRSGSTAIPPALRCCRTPRSYVAFSSGPFARLILGHGLCHKPTRRARPSMDGIMTHTLLSDFGYKLWDRVISVRPEMFSGRHRSFGLSMNP